MADMKVAKFLGVYKGKRVYRWGVRVMIHKLFESREVGRVTIAAPSAADALYTVKKEYCHKVFEPFEVDTLGPKGGRYARFAGWESIIWEMMNEHGDGRQLAFCMAHKSFHRRQ
jgi:hypothetical protein